MEGVGGEGRWEGLWKANHRKKGGGEEERGGKDRLKEVQTREVMEVLEAMMVVVGGGLPGP